MTSNNDNNISNLTKQTIRIIEALTHGRFRISENRLRVILTFLKPEPDETGNALTESEIMKKVIDDFKVDGGVLEEETPFKKVYRKRSELPVPTKKADAEINRLKKQFKIRVYPEIRQRLDDAAKEAGMTRQEWVEQLLTNALEKK